MQMFKKNIILIPADYNGVSNQKGVLSLNYESDKVVGSLRCFNVKPTDEEYSIGVQIGDNVFKTKATAKELGNLKIQINGNANNTSKVSVAIVSLKGKSYETLLWGSTETTKAIRQHAVIQSLLEKTNILEMQEQLKQSTFDQLEQMPLEEQQNEIFEQQLLDDYIDKEIKRTEVKAESEPNFSSHEKVRMVGDDSKTKSGFYSKIENQIKQIFESNEPDRVLENIIPDSKFCKVMQGDDFYVFGVIYENGKEKCICYGIPSEYSLVPPKEVEGFSQWLPIDADNYAGKGYWMTYQDAVTGENIAVEIV